MLKVTIPNNNIPERSYILDILLSNFLGISYKLFILDGSDNYIFKFENSELVFSDRFFNKFPEPLNYLRNDAIPEDILWARNDFIPEDDIPVLFGDDRLIVKERYIESGIDIFASSFFLLTRWEEYVSKERDMHNRFPGSDCFAFKNRFLHRPLVNEYVEMLWKMLQKLGYKGQRKKREFNLVLTHDIDGLRYVLPKTIAGDIIKRRNLFKALNNSKYLFVKDPYDTFEFLMNISEKLGVRSHFYFMSTNSRMEYDTGFYLNTKRFRSRIKCIKERGHIIGFHPGYYTYSDVKRWSLEKSLLEEAIQQNIYEGRQHFLRIDVPKTLAIWEMNSMNIDSTLGYADVEGFRCGTGDQFTVFDFLQRRPLNLKERPLVIMDGTLLYYRNYSKEKVLEIFNHYISIGRKYNSAITLLFHNSSFFGEWERYESVYEEVLKR